MSQEAFQCQMCGRCCQGEGGIVVSARDRARLCRLLDLSPEELHRRYTEPRNGQTYLTTNNRGFCIFFQPERGCAVHSHKPDICRAWPFFLGNLKDALSWRMAQDDCPGINRDIEHAEFVRQGLEYLRRHGLSGDPDGPHSLQIDDLLRTFEQ
jgi:hypothetical protein